MDVWHLHGLSGCDWYLGLGHRGWLTCIRSKHILTPPLWWIRWISGSIWETKRQLQVAKQVVLQHPFYPKLKKQKLRHKSIWRSSCLPFMITFVTLLMKLFVFYRRQNPKVIVTPMKSRLNPDFTIWVGPAVGMRGHLPCIEELPVQCPMGETFFPGFVLGFIICNGPQQKNGDPNNRGCR